MGFRIANFGHLAKFNSSTSSDFLDFYRDYVESNIKAKSETLPHKAFAPSSMRCKRRSWFRLRGVEPDQPKSADWTLNFTAEIGTACHAIIQRNLKSALGGHWISVSDYLKKNPVLEDYRLDEGDLETKIEIIKPFPVRFAVDGIIYWKGEYYLLEIKTSEFASFNELTDPKAHHLDQIKTYASLLHIHKVLVLYQDRQYGDLKCYEEFISDATMQAVKDDMQYVMDMVDANLAPERLPTGDAWCSPSQCQYYKRCKEW